MKTYSIKGGYLSRVAVFQFDADELRGIASALGPDDTGAQEMLRAAEEMDALDEAGEW